MKMRAMWFAVWGLLILAAADVASNLLELFDVQDTMKKGSAPEDILGYGIAPVWIAIGFLLAIVLFLGRSHVHRNQVALVLAGFLALLIADWAMYLKLLASMGL
jgi:FtsH-binding integral membrane protein